MEEEKKDTTTTAEPEVEKVEAKERTEEPTSDKDQEAAGEEKGFVKEFWSKNKAVAAQVGYIAEGFFAIVFGVLWLVLINVFYDDIGFLTDEFDEVLVWINIGAAVSLLTHMGLIIVRRGWYKAIKNIINDLFSLVSTYVMWSVFPFDFADRYNFVEDILPYVLIFLMFALVVGMFGEVFKAFKGLVERAEERV